jgi:tetratricopeptide (TPR) repeat protein
VNKLATSQPDVVDYRVKRASVASLLGRTLGRMGKLEDARATVERALDDARRVAAQQPDSPLRAHGLAQTLNFRALVEFQAGRFDEGRTWERHAIAAEERALAAQPANLLYRRELLTFWSNMRQAARDLGDPAGLAEAEGELARINAQNPLTTDANARLSAFLRGEGQPRDPADRILLAGCAYNRKLYVAAVRLCSEAFEADPRLVEDAGAVHRTNAAGAALLASCGLGEDSPPDEPARARLRDTAITWLEAELAKRRKLVESGGAPSRAEAIRFLANWKITPSYAGITDPEKLARLPESEQARIAQFWGDVDDQLARWRAHE